MEKAELGKWYVACLCIKDGVVVASSIWDEAKDKEECLVQCAISAGPDGQPYEVEGHQGYLVEQSIVELNAPGAQWFLYPRWEPTGMCFSINFSRHEVCLWGGFLRERHFVCE